MARDDRTIDVFLASPGDVDEERAAARRVVDDLEVTHRQAGWSIRIWGWEQARPGLGRAQDLINPRVDGCDVLVGVLGQNWGTPTGEFSSGFEEEFERLRVRRDAGEEVEAMIFVRRLVDEDQAAPQNLEFRERLRELALYKQYEGVADFELSLQRALGSYVVERVNATASQEEAVPESPPQEAGGASEGLPAGGGEGGPQSQAALEAVSRAVTGDSDELAVVDLIRAHLATAAELSNRRSGATLDAHDLVAAYRFRGEIDLTPGEIRLIDRTMAELGYTAPGWGLTGKEDWALRFGGIALEDSDADVRAGALRELGVDGIRLLVEGAPGGGASETNFYKHILEDESERVRKVALHLVREAKPEGAMELLADLFESSGSIDVFKSLMPLLLETDPEKAIELALGHPVWVDDFEARLAEIAPSVAEETMRSATTDSPSSKRLALKLLSAQDNLSEDEARDELEADSRPVRLEALNALIEMGVEVDEETVEAVGKESDAMRSLLDTRGPSVRSAWIERLPTDELRTRARWGHLGLDGADALVALLARDEDPGMLEKVRAGLAGDLEPLRKEGVESLVERFGGSEAAKRALNETLEPHKELYDSIWVAGSLRGLATRGPEPVDAELARLHINSQDLRVRDAAARVLGLAGTRADAPELLSYAADRYGEDAACALAAAGRLVDTGEDLLSAGGVNGDQPPRLASLLREIYRARLSLDLDKIRGLLHDRDTSIRRAALAVAVRGLSKEELLDLLERYSHADTNRFYDVIGVLDRLIYAPTEIAMRARSWLAPSET